MPEPHPRPPIAARLSEAGAVIEVGESLYLRVDGSGRWTAFGEGGALFRRTVDGRVHVPGTGAASVLDDPRADTVHGWVVRRTAEVLEALREAGPKDVVVHGDRAALVQLLERTACGAPPGPAEDRTRFEHAYPETVPILPPHRYRDVVVMPATGCPNHACRFCAFYRDRPFRLVAKEDFRAHLEAVRDLFGEALAARDGVFLGSASALSLTDEVLLDRLGQVEQVLGRPRRGVASFLDPDRGRVREPADWSRLADAGLVEATVGLETGLPALRRDVGKSADLERFVDVVAAIKAGGLVVSLTVLVGLGGADRAQAHREATLEVLGRMPLDARDRVYLSRLDAGEGLEAEESAFRSACRSALPSRVGDYRIDRFAWFA